MNYNIKGLRITGHPDFEGQWSKEDAIEEIHEILGYSAEEAEEDWIRWILDHDFSENDISSDLIETFVKIDDFMSFVAMIDNHRVKVEKLLH